MNLQSFSDTVTSIMSKKSGTRLPLSVRERRRDFTEYDGPHEEVPEWLEPSLSLWVRASTTDRNEYGQTRIPPGVVLGISRVVRKKLPEVDGRPEYYELDQLALRSCLQKDASLYLDVVDCLLASSPPNLASALQEMLTESGSAWTVTRVGEAFCLARRIDETTQQAAKQLMAEEDPASRYLRVAWARTYGRNPDPVAGYAAAVKAAEAAMHAVVTPNNKNATLGTMLGDLNANKEQWAVVLKDDDGTKQVERVIGMCQLIWKAHHDRHGKRQPERKPVSQAEAEHAVHVAIAIVHLFREGGVVQR